jgi:hypothetical protein
VEKSFAYQDDFLQCEFAKNIFMEESRPWKNKKLTSTGSAQVFRTGCPQKFYLW